MVNVFDVTEFGAVGDGKTHCTAAIQKAIDEAAKVKGAVILPPGKYLCGYLKLYPSITFEGYHGWAYRETGGTTLVLDDDTAKCMLDITGAFGACIKGIQFNGNKLKGENIHGIYFDAGKYNGGVFGDEKDDNPLLEPTHSTFREDNFVITDCQCKNFSGDGIHLDHIFAFTVSDCQIMSNGGDGIYINGWDGWIHDCVIHTNDGAGVGSVKPDKDGECCCYSITMTGNRIEWNRGGGMHFTTSDSLNINNNMFDRSGGPAIKFEDNDNTNITIVGNIFRRSGKKNWGEFKDKYDNSHLYIKNGVNQAITGNVFVKGIDDEGQGELTPMYNIVYNKKCDLQLSCNGHTNGCIGNEIITIED